MVTIAFIVCAVILIISAVSVLNKNQKAEKQTSPQDIRSRRIDKFISINNKRNALIQSLQELSLQESLFENEMTKIRDQNFDSITYNDFACIKDYLSNKRIEYQSIAIDIDIISNEEVQAKGPYIIPEKYTNKLANGDFISVKDNFLQIPLLKYDLMKLIEKEINSIEILGTWLIQCALNNDKMAYADTRKNLDSLGVFLSYAEKSIIQKLDSNNLMVQELTNAINHQSNLLVNGFLLLDSKLSTIESNLSRIESNTKAQTYISAYNAYNTREIKKALK